MNQIDKPPTMCGIYGLRCRTTNKWYVGQSLDIVTRWNKAYKKLRCKDQIKLYHALLKYGYDDFDKVVLEECLPDVELMNAREDHWIIAYNSIDDGYNIRHGGSHGKLSEETKEKISKALTGRKLSKDICKKMSIARTGKPGHRWTNEERLRISNQQRGKIISVDCRRKISNALVGRKKKPFSAEHRRKLALAILGKKRGPYKQRRMTEKAQIAYSRMRGVKKSKVDVENMKLGIQMRKAAGLSFGRPKKQVVDIAITTAYAPTK